MPPRPPGRRAAAALAHLLASGSSTTRKPSTLARIQPGRSTTATCPAASSVLDIPVTSRTGRSSVARTGSRNSATTCLASARLT